MFDGIAGVYDLLNTAMTAGLHHRWRARAADLARVGPGVARARRGDRARATWRSSSPGASRPDGEVVGSDFSEGMLARAREKAAARDAPRRAPALRVGRRAGAALRRRRLRRGDGGLRRAQLLRPRARAGGDGSRGAPRRARGRAGDHHADEAAAVALLRGVVRSHRAGARPRRHSCSARAAVRRSARSDGRAPARGGGRVRSPTPTPTCRARSSAFPAPRELAAELERAGLQEIRYVLMAGGIVAIHAGNGAARGGAP